MYSTNITLWWLGFTVPIFLNGFVVRSPLFVMAAQGYEPLRMNQHRNEYMGEVSTNKLVSAVNDKLTGVRESSFIIELVEGPVSSPPPPTHPSQIRFDLDEYAHHAYNPHRERARAVVTCNLLPGPHHE